MSWHGFIRAFIRSLLVHSIINLFVLSFINLFINSFVCSLLHLFIHSLVQKNHSIVDASIDSFIHWFDSIIFNQCVCLSAGYQDLPNSCQIGIILCYSFVYSCTCQLQAFVFLHLWMVSPCSCFIVIICWFVHRFAPLTHGYVFVVYLHVLEWGCLKLEGARRCSYIWGIPSFGALPIAWLVAISQEATFHAGTQPWIMKGTVHLNQSNVEWRLQVTHLSSNDEIRNMACVPPLPHEIARNCVAILE